MMTVPQARRDGPGAVRYYVLALLLVAYTLNFMDRYLLVIVQEAIREEFGLSDLQLGILSGPAFVLLYGGIALPIARMAERYDRINILSLCMCLWSVATAVCGLAPSFGTMLAARVGVSIGDGGCTPTAQSLIADYFHSSERSTALGIYALGISFGVVGASWMAGTIAEPYGWRTAFLILAVPGVLVGIVLRTTVREPPRPANHQAPGLTVALKSLIAKPTFRHLLAAFCLATLATYGVGNYQASFLMRAHGMSFGDAASTIGVIIGLFGAISTFGGGFAVDLLAKRFKTAILWLPAIGLTASVPLYFVSFMSPALELVIVALSAATFASYMYWAPLAAVALGLAQPNSRATVVAVFLVVGLLVGNGLGPPIVGAISDALGAWFLQPEGLRLTDCRTEAARGPQCDAASAFGLRWAMAGILIANAWAAVHLMLARQTLRTDLVD